MASNWRWRPHSVLSCLHWITSSIKFLDHLHGLLVDSPTLSWKLKKLRRSLKKKRIINFFCNPRYFLEVLNIGSFIFILKKLLKSFKNLLKLPKILLWNQISQMKGFLSIIRYITTAKRMKYFCRYLMSNKTTILIHLLSFYRKNSQRRSCGEM